jgi:phage baseplate assembly protein V
MTDVFSHLMASGDADQRFFGVAVGLVTNNKDPDGLGRVKVKLPWLGDTAESDWARVASPMAGAARGLYLLPEVDDEVLIAFEHGNPETVYVLGGLWNGKDKPPESNSDGKNDRRTLKSRSGHVIRLTDTKDAETIEIIDKSAKNSVVISTKDNSITITADADITITSTKGKLVLSGKGGVEITSGAALKAEAKGNLDLKGGPQLNVRASAVNIN